MKKDNLNKTIYFILLIVIAIFIYYKLFNKNTEIIDNPTPSTTTISINNIYIDKENIIMASGANDILKITIEPSNANLDQIIIESSNPSVATISNNGEIKALNKGNATIKVRSIDGTKEKTCEIKVIETIVFDQRNIAIIDYLNNDSSEKMINTYKQYNCSKENCMKPQKYLSSINDQINVYKYNIDNNTKELLVTTNNNEINDYLYPNNTYYLESLNNNDDIEIVKITGNVRIPDVPKLKNIRDLGGWNADGGTVKYGRLFRSERPDSDASVLINNLMINKVVDLREKDQVEKSGTSSSLNNFRKIITTLNYSTDKSGHSRDAVLEIMESIVNNQNVLFHCQVGRDRTGTIAYLLEGILGVPLNNRHIDYELSYLALGERTRTFGNYNNLINKINAFNMTNYEQERFINWFLSFSTNKEQDLNLINNFRKVMIDGNPHIYKIENDTLVLD